MNICILSAQLIRYPLLIKIKDDYVYIALIKVPNNKLSLSFCTLRTLCSNYLLFSLISLQKKEDFVIAQGSISINNQITNLRNNKKQKQVVKQINFHLKEMPSYIYKPDI